MPEGIGRYNQVDDGPNILQRLALIRPDDLYNKLHEAGYGRYNEEYQHNRAIDDGRYKGAANCRESQ